MKNILFIGVTPYPNGQASTNRLVSLFSELASLEWKIQVLCLSSTKCPTSFKNGEPYYEREGIEDNVFFRYLSLKVKASRSIFLRSIYSFYGWLILPLYLIRNTNSSDTSVVLTNLTQVYYVVYLKILCEVCNKKLILLRSEYPKVIRTNGFKSIIFKIFFEKWIFRSFDGFVLMTNTLENYFTSLKKIKAQVKLIPMTVDISRFNIHQVSPFNFDYIVYAGSLSHKKDGIDILLKSFASIAGYHREIRLVIIGDNSDPGKFKETSDLILTLSRDIAARIIFTGRLDSSEIPGYLLNAKVMALARPDSLQAKGGFPTKLGEYLATGNPVVVTSVGEIPLYLKHMDSALMANPGDINDFARNLDWVLRNSSLAIEIGLRGRRVAETVFNAKIQAAVLSEFLTNFLTSFSPSE